MRAIVALLLSLIAVATASAAEMSDDDVRRAIADLNADKFDVREQASADLVRAGRAAIEPLVKAADGPSLEVTTRATNVLKELADSRDPATRGEARAAIEKLAKSENPAVASRAAAVLKPEEGTARRGFVIQGGAVFGGRIQMGIGRQGAQVMEFQGLNAGARRNINVRENGKAIAINEDPQQGITVSVSETVKGTAQTSLVQAKDAEELKEKHPDAYKYYERYVLNRRIGVGGVGAILGEGRGGRSILQLPPIPRIDIGPPGARRPPAINPKAVERLQQSHLRMRDALNQMMRQQLAGGNLDEEALQKLLEQLEAANRDVAEAQQANE